MNKSLIYKFFFILVSRLSFEMRGNSGGKSVVYARLGHLENGDGAAGCVFKVCGTRSKIQTATGTHCNLLGCKLCPKVSWLSHTVKLAAPETLKNQYGDQEGGDWSCIPILQWAP